MFRDLDQQPTCVKRTQKTDCVNKQTRAHTHTNGRTLVREAWAEEGFCDANMCYSKREFFGIQNVLLLLRVVRKGDSCPATAFVILFINLIF